MRIINRTKWNTRDLQRIFYEVIKRDCEEGKWKGLQVTCQTRNDGSVRGRAWLGCKSVRMILPVKWEKSITLQRSIAYIFQHELKHCRGRDHYNIVDSPYPHEEFSWADSLPLNLVSETKGDIKLKRYNHALQMLTSKKSLLKRLQTSIQSWSQKIRYYERLGLASKVDNKETENEV